MIKHNTHNTHTHQLVGTASSSNPSNLVQNLRTTSASPTQLPNPSRNPNPNPKPYFLGTGAIKTTPSSNPHRRIFLVAPPNSPIVSWRLLCYHSYLLRLIKTVTALVFLLIEVTLILISRSFQNVFIPHHHQAHPKLPRSIHLCVLCFQAATPYTRTDAR